jgi:hypothetical protein
MRGKVLTPLYIKTCGASLGRSAASLLVGSRPQRTEVRLRCGLARVPCISSNPAPRHSSLRSEWQAGFGHRARLGAALECGSLLPLSAPGLATACRLSCVLPRLWALPSGRFAPFRRALRLRVKVRQVRRALCGLSLSSLCGPGTTRTTAGLNQGRIIHKPQPSFLRDLCACGLHRFPLVSSVPPW